MKKFSIFKVHLNKNILYIGTLRQIFGQTFYSHDLPYERPTLLKAYKGLLDTTLLKDFNTLLEVYLFKGFLNIHLECHPVKGFHNDY